MFRTRPWNFVNVSVILSIHLAALAGFFVSPTPVLVMLLIFHYLWFGLASSLYYHRCLTHRSFELALPLHLFFLLGGLIGLGGDPIRWVGIHRYHHAHADEESDAHSPTHGFLYAYIGWQMKMDLDQVEKWTRLAPDLKKMWFLRLARGNGPSALIHVAYAILIYSQLGWPGLLFGLYLPLALSYQFCWMLIASLCHRPGWGSRRSETSDQSRNIWWLAPITFGESFHNNHHDEPRRLRQGLQWYEWDLSAWLVFLFEKLRLAHSVVR